MRKLEPINAASPEHLHFKLDSLRAMVLASAAMLIVACASETVSAPKTPDVALKLAKAPADPTSTFYLSNDVAHLLRGDGLYVESANSKYSGTSRYMEAECGVHSQIFATPGGSGDAIMGSAFTVDRRCANYPRGIRLSFALINGDGSTAADGTEAAPTFMNVKTLEQAAANGAPAVYIPVGSTQLRYLLFNDNSGKCAELRFRPVLQDGTVTGSDQVQVTRTAADSWIVQTQPDETDPITLRTIHHDKVWCQNNGKLYHMPTYLVIKSASPLVP